MPLELSMYPLQKSCLAMQKVPLFHLLFSYWVFEVSSDSHQSLCHSGSVALLFLSAFSGLCHSGLIAMGDLSPSPLIF